MLINRGRGATPWTRRLSIVSYRSYCEAFRAFQSLNGSHLVATCFAFGGLSSSGVCKSSVACKLTLRYGPLRLDAIDVYIADLFASNKKSAFRTMFSTRYLGGNPPHFARYNPVPQKTCLTDFKY